MACRWYQSWSRGQNVLKTFEMAIRHNRRTTRTESESFLSLDLFSLSFKNIFLVLFRGGGRSPPFPPHMDSCIGYQSIYGGGAAVRTSDERVAWLIWNKVAGSRDCLTHARRATTQCIMLQQITARNIDCKKNRDAIHFTSCFSDTATSAWWHFTATLLLFLRLMWRHLPTL